MDSATRRGPGARSDDDPGLRSTRYGSAQRRQSPPGRNRSSETGRNGHDTNGHDTNGHDENGRGGDGLATFLGWFSIGLGLAQVAAPRAVARLVGAPADSRGRTAMRALGLRELTSGVGVLSNPSSAGWMWSRVAGDAMDLALLGGLLRDDDADRERTVAATAAVLGVAALDVICAQRLSRDSANGADGSTGSTANGAATEDEKGIHTIRTLTIRRSPEDVYAFWHDFENLPRFMRHLESVRVLDDRRSHWVTRAPAGRTVEWDAVITEDRPNELISWRSVEGADVRNSGTVRFTPAPGDQGTEVHVELRYDPPGGVLGSRIAMLFREEPGQQVQDDLYRFKQVMETGDIVVSDATVKRGTHPAQPLPMEGR